MCYITHSSRGSNNDRAKAFRAYFCEDDGNLLGGSFINNFTRFEGRKE